MLKSFSIFILILSNYVLSSAQDIRKDSLRNSFSLGIGLAGYTGDICDNFSCRQFGPSFGISYKFMVFSFFRVRTDLSYFIIKQDDVEEERNLGFRSHNFEAFEAIELGIFNRKVLSPYAFLGVGFNWFSPQARSKSGEWVSLRPLQTEKVNYEKNSLIIPFGAGINVKVSSKVQLNLEGGFRITFTDYLDDVSSYHYQPLDSFSDPLAAELSLRAAEGSEYRRSYLKFDGNGELIAGQQRGNPKRRDHYFLFMFKVKVNF